eukprot:TRINITY_DN7960_c0_g2_i2.p1 TRINITY_DN7960_c0_g2~~TRINITY_DN7960_c0_g2_i2.p1  ORF type:complete len:137 (-),score=32.28 TRINITY_DN7960_c0_g2_i2:16-426(-)
MLSIIHLREEAMYLPSKGLKGPRETLLELMIHKHKIIQPIVHHYWLLAIHKCLEQPSEGNRIVEIGQFLEFLCLFVLFSLFFCEEEEGGEPWLGGVWDVGVHGELTWEVVLDLLGEEGPEGGGPFEGVGGPIVLLR